MVSWQRQASAWLRGKAAEQAQINERFPQHVRCYPSWTERVKQLQDLAEELDREAEEEARKNTRTAFKGAPSKTHYTAGPKDYP